MWKKSCFLRAVRYCEETIVRYLVEQGARLDGCNQVGSGAYSQAYYGNKRNIPLIHELGLDIKLHGELYYVRLCRILTGKLSLIY